MTLTLHISTELHLKLEQLSREWQCPIPEVIARLLAYRPVVHGGSLPGGQSKTAWECD